MLRERIPREEYALSLGQFAYVWGLPAVLAAQYRLSLTQPLEEGEERAPWDFSAELNQLGRATTPLPAANRSSVGYNNDTLYGVGLFDLDQEPFVILSPDFGDRYWVTMVSDLFDDVVGNIGARNTGATAPPTFLIGPNWDGKLPEDAKLILHVPSRYALVANRIEIGDDNDLEAARALQAQVDVLPLGKYLNPTYQFPSKPQRTLRPEESKVTPDLSFFEALGEVIREQSPRTEEKMAILGVLHELKITPEKGFAYEELDPSTKVGMRRAVHAAEALIREATGSLGTTVNGWSMNLDVGRSGNHYLQRAALAVDTPFANVPEEALYMACDVDEKDQALSGEHSYRLCFQRGQQPPVDAFWSITLYDAEGYMIENEIDRCAIGDRTPGLQPSKDGTIEIVIQQEPPDEQSNWLPAPEGEFYLVLRCYLPQAPILQREWSPPPVERVE